MIWRRYQEEGLAGKKMLKAGAPRPPKDDTGDEPEEKPKTEDAPPAETKKAAPKKSAPAAKAAPKKAKEKTVPVNVSEPPRIDLQPLLDEVKALNGSLGLLAEGIQGGLQEAQAERKQLFALVEMQQMLIQNVILPALGAITKLSGHGIGELVGDFTWPKGAKLGEEVGRVQALIDGASTAIAEPKKAAPKKRTRKTTKKAEKQAPPEEPKSPPAQQDTKSKRQTKKPPKKSSVPPKKLKTPAPNDRTYQLDVEGKELSFTMAELTNKKTFPQGLLNKMGVSLGLQLAPVDRVTKISLICEALDQN